jgi:hypothetical protein
MGVLIYDVGEMTDTILDERRVGGSIQICKSFTGQQFQPERTTDLYSRIPESYHIRTFLLYLSALLITCTNFGCSSPLCLVG